MDRKSIYDKYSGHCAYCGTKMDFKDMQVDHYHPKHKKCYFDDNDNQWKDVNNINNLMPSCRTCNHYKRGDLPENFKQLMMTLHERIEKIYIVRVAIKHGILSMKQFDGKFYFETFK
jgi:5-methylcytosine-specific restriction endonuclease McrA